MTRREYVDRVAAASRWVTPREQAEIRAELDAHIEDHIYALLELGYDESLAEERTMLRMGDPEEVGRALGRQYPLRWLVIGRLSMVLTVLLTVLMLPSLWKLGGQVAQSLLARLHPLYELDMRYVMFAADEGFPVENAERVYLRQTADGVTMWVYQAGLEEPTAEETTAWLAISWYSENLFQKAPQRWEDVTAPDGREITSTHFGWDDQWLIHAPVTRGEALSFAYEGDGRRYDFTVELPWEEAGI